MRQRLDWSVRGGSPRGSRRIIREADLFYADLLGAPPAPAPAPAAPRRAGPAFVFDEVVYRSHGPVVRLGDDGEAWEVVARPAMPVARARLRDGDKVLQRPEGE